MAGKRHHSRRAVVLGVGLGVVLIGAGLATPTMVRALSSNPTIHVRQLGATQRVDQGLVMAPVPAGVRPKIDAGAAVAETARQDGRLRRLDSVDATLALITDEQFGHTNPDDSVIPYYKNCSRG